MSRRIPLIASLVFLIAGLVIGFALYERKATLDRTDRHICVAIQNINEVVTQQLQRTKENLPKVSYFRSHPDELQRQLRQLNEQLIAFRPRKCQ